MIARLRTALAAFVARHVIAADPCPEYSALDLRDGLGR